MGMSYYKQSLVPAPIQNQSLKNQSRTPEFVPNIVLTSVMSLLPKIDEIRMFFSETHSIDLFFISETCLKSNVGDDQLILPGYKPTTLNGWIVELEFMGRLFIFQFEI
jgi:hypothetical protein